MLSNSPMPGSSLTNQRTAERRRLRRPPVAAFVTARPVSSCPGVRPSAVQPYTRYAPRRVTRMPPAKIARPYCWLVSVMSPRVDDWNVVGSKAPVMVSSSRKSQIATNQATPTMTASITVATVRGTMPAG